MKNGTHGKNNEVPDDICLPGGNCFFINLRMEKSKHSASFQLLVDVLLDLLHSPAIERGKRTARDIHRWLDSLSQLFNRLTEGLAELVFSSPLYPPVKGLKYILAGFRELDKVCFVECRLLHAFA